MHDLESFAVSGQPSATFPHHSLKTVTHFLRLRQYISWKELQIRLLYRNSTSHYLHSALLCRKELHCWGSWLSFDMDSKVARICLNAGLSWITTQTGVTAVKPTWANLHADWTKRLCSLLTLLPSSFSWVQQNWQDSHWGWLASERHPDKDKPYLKSDLLPRKAWNRYSQFPLNNSVLHRCWDTMWKLFFVGTLAAVVNITTTPQLPSSLCQCESIRPPSEQKASASDFNPGGKKKQTQMKSDRNLPVSPRWLDITRSGHGWMCFILFCLFVFTQTSKKTQKKHAPGETCSCKLVNI